MEAGRNEERKLTLNFTKYEREYLAKWHDGKDTRLEFGRTRCESKTIISKLQIPSSSQLLVWDLPLYSSTGNVLTALFTPVDKPITLASLCEVAELTTLTGSNQSVSAYGREQPINELLWQGRANQWVVGFALTNHAFPTGIAQAGHPRKRCAAAPSTVQSNSHKISSAECLGF